MNQHYFIKVNEVIVCTGNFDTAWEFHEGIILATPKKSQRLIGRLSEFTEGAKLEKVSIYDLICLWPHRTSKTQIYLDYPGRDLRTEPILKAELNERGYFLSEHNESGNWVKIEGCIYPFKELQKFDTFIFSSQRITGIDGSNVKISKGKCAVRLPVEEDGKIGLGTEFEVIPDTLVSFIKSTLKTDYRSKISSGVLTQIKQHLDNDPEW